VPRPTYTKRLTACRPPQVPEEHCRTGHEVLSKAFLGTCSDLLHASLSYLATCRTRTGYRAADAPPETPPTTAPVAHDPVTAHITMTTNAVPTTTIAMNPLMRRREGAARDMPGTVPRVLAVIATHRSIGKSLPVVLRRSFTWDQGPELLDWKTRRPRNRDQLLRPAQA